MSGILLALSGVTLTQPVTVNANWGSYGGDPAADSDTAARTLTVPAGNPGSLNFAMTKDIFVSTPQYQKNGGAFTNITDGLDVTFANGDTLKFRVPAGGGDGVAIITVTDNLRGDAVGDATATLAA